MFNNRKYINELIKENESLNVLIKFWEQSYELAKVKNKKLQADIENKENRICNLIEENKELSQHNNFLENQNMPMNKEDVKSIEEMKTNFDIVAKEPKEEVTAKELKNEFTKFCEVYGITCRGCKFSEGLEEDCRTLWILDNYNVTRKENK